MPVAFTWPYSCGPAIGIRPSRQPPGTSRPIETDTSFMFHVFFCSAVYICKYSALASAATGSRVQASICEGYLPCFALWGKQLLFTHWHFPGNAAPSKFGKFPVSKVVEPYNEPTRSTAFVWIILFVDYLEHTLVWPRQGCPGGASLGHRVNPRI
jgi:hypothetical protein